MDFKNLRRSRATKILMDYSGGSGTHVSKI